MGKGYVMSDIEVILFAVGALVGPTSAAWVGTKVGLSALERRLDEGMKGIKEQIDGMTSTQAKHGEKMNDMDKRLAILEDRRTRPGRRVTDVTEA